MSTTITCECGKSYFQSGSRVGKPFRCHLCGRMIAVPLARTGTAPVARETSAITELTNSSPQDERIEEARSSDIVRARSRRSLVRWAGLSDFTVAMIVLEIVSVIALALGFIWPAAVFLPVVLGGLLVIVGQISFLTLVFQDKDDPVAGALCLFVPVYQLIYLVKHFHEMKQPFVMQLMGMFILVQCVVMSIVR